jgi:hypothetical protein
MYSYSVATPTGEGFFAQEIPNESEPIDKIMLPEGSGMMVGGYRAVSAQSHRYRLADLVFHPLAKTYDSRICNWTWQTLCNIVK